MLPNADGSINVKAEIVSGTIVEREVVSEFGHADAVPSGATVTIVSYTVPVAKKFFLQRVEYGGNNVATYELLIDGAVQQRERTWFNGPLSDEMNFSSSPREGLEIASGKIVLVRVENFRPSVGDFEARIHGSLEG